MTRAPAAEVPTDLVVSTAAFWLSAEKVPPKRNR